MQDDIKLIAEGQMGFHEKFERIDERFDNIDERFERIENKLDRIDIENKGEHKAIMDYLSRLEDEMMDIKEKLESIEENKADKRGYEFLKKRVDVLERQVEKFGVLLKVKNV